MELTLEFADNFLKLLDAMSLYVMFGLFIAGILKQLVPKDFVSSHLGSNSTTSVIKATIFGIPLPVCSCSVIPLAQGLKNEGASKGAVQSFLISTPITGVDSILATFSFFGFIFTIFRIISSVIIAIIVGLLQNYIEKDEKKIEVVNKNKFSTVQTPAFSQNLAANKLSFSLKNENIQAPKEKKTEKFSFINIFKYGYGVLFADMAKALLIGLVLGAAFTTFVPQEYSKLLFDNKILTYFVILLIAIPLYTCATASLPIAAAFMIQGMSAGAAFIFLTAGPATSLVTMSVIYKMLGRTSLIIYTGTIACLSLIFGFFFDMYTPNLEILNLTHEMEELSILSSFSSLIMLLLIMYHLFKLKFKKAL